MELRLKFDEDAGNYNKWRPTYVPELFEEIIRYCALGKKARALEIGIGTGQATEPILKTGCHVTAIELGENLWRYVRTKFRQLQNFEALHLDFVNFEDDFNAYDLIYSATAFHWIPPEIGYRRVYDLLKPGGTVALFWNHPFVNRADDALL